MIRALRPELCGSGKGGYRDVGSSCAIQLALVSSTAIPTSGRTPHIGTYWHPGDYETSGLQRGKVVDTIIKRELTKQVL
jgi:hypothetical protein